MKIPENLKTLDYNFTSDPSLIDKVKIICARLEKYGWGELLKLHGLDIMSTDLKSELLKPLHAIDRTLPGFEDFAAEGIRGIEPGKPALSLLFHALASPQVVRSVDGSAIQIFPNLAEIEIVENLVYGIKPPSIQEIRVKTRNAPLAIVVFSSEYRPAISNVHQRHADVCYSRVGVSRVGTVKHKYAADSRGYLPFTDESDPYNVRVIPCKFSAYLAVQLPGSLNDFGPFRFTEGPDGDISKNFWVPVHKLFNGSECIRNMSLNVSLSAHHINEKLRRVHLELASKGYDTGWHVPEIDKWPFVIQEGLAEFSTDLHDGSGLLVPIVHDALVENIHYDGKPLTFKVQPNFDLYGSSINIKSKAHGGRNAPEYLHARHKLEKDNTVTDLNDSPTLQNDLLKGEYEALHYLDYTAEGFIDVYCPELVLEVPETRPAYSMIGPVDFFPLVKQAELTQWWSQSVPEELEDNIWPTNPGPPKALCDIRYPANLSLTFKTRGTKDKPISVFNEKDNTISAIVGHINSGLGQLTQINELVNYRISSLPDSASGVFAPGWDTSINRTEEIEQEDQTTKPGIFYFNNYGLGSPFPEDAMLCAALSSFWPAAAPDITRTFAPGKYATATPLTDDVLGQTGLTAWDDISGPIIPDPNVKEVEYRNILYGDYTNTAIKKRFNFSLISKISAAEYAARTLIMARVYSSLGAVTREEKVQWAIYSFIHTSANDSQLKKAESETGVNLNDNFTYRFQVFKHKPVPEGRKPRDHKNLLVGYDKMLIIFADPKTVLTLDEGKWEVNRY